MQGDNPEVHKRYVELSVNRFRNDLPNMEPRAVAHLIRACGRVCCHKEEWEGMEEKGIKVSGKEINER
jgi:hypothetical protein